MSYFRSKVSAISSEVIIVITYKAIQALYSQAKRAISIGQLHTSLCFHTQPINVVVYNGSLGKSNLKVGFPLRCFQRLSHPNIATRQCDWRHNRNTRGSSTLVLSYQEQILSNFQRPRQIGTDLSQEILNKDRKQLKKANRHNLGTCFSPRMR